jgi:hypothetical protein
MLISFAFLREKHKLLVTCYPGIWNSHAAGNNLKENMLFCKATLKNTVALYVY